MKTEKLIRSVFASESSGRTNGVIALIAGLAAGAVLGILFAPESGESARNKIRDAAGRLFGAEQQEDQHAEAIRSTQHNTLKRPRSDIKNLIHEAHVHDAAAAETAAES
jgi:gas vesicle protein